MFYIAYVYCGLFYVFYFCHKIIMNKEQFLELAENDLGKDKIKVFLFFMSLTNFFLWPIMMMLEIVTL